MEIKEIGRSTTNFIDLLLVLFIALKLLKVIDWSWWWVLSPVWIPLGLIILVGIVMVIIVIITKINK